MPHFLSFLLHRTRAAMLAMLLVVLPLQGVVQLVAGIQGHRHVHTGAPGEISLLGRLAQPLKAVLDRLHDAQDVRLKGSPSAWVKSSGPTTGMHEHGGVFHQHSPHTADVLDVSDSADSAMHDVGGTAFLAWLPSPWVMAAGPVSDRPETGLYGWRDRAIEPPLAPPRG